MLCLLLNIVLSIPGQSAISIEPGLYSYGELAQKLSTPERRISANPDVLQRACVVALKNKPWSDVQALLPAALGIRLVDAGDGNYVLEEDPAAKSLDIKLFNAYCAAFDNQAAAVVREIKRIAGNAIPPDPDLLTDEIRRRLDPTSAASIESLVGRADTSEKRALSMLFGIASGREWTLSSSGPLFYFFYYGGSVRKLIPTDQVDSGNAYYWRDRQNLPEWVRTRAVATVRSAESNISVDNSAGPAAVDRIARNTLITHRLHYSPLVGAPQFTYSILVYVERADGWWGANTVRALQVTQDEKLLASLHQEAESSSDFAARRASTNALLIKDWATKLAPVGNESNLSKALTEWAKTQGRDIVMEASTVRDICQSRSGSRSLRSLAGWLDIPQGGGNTRLSNDPLREDRPRGLLSGQAAPPSWTLSEKLGVLIVNNEYRFLDKHYGAPLHDLLALERQMSAGFTYDQLEAHTALLTGPKLAHAARTLYSPLSVEPAHWMPWIRLFQSLGARKQDVVGNLAPGTAKSIPMLRFGNVAVARFAQEIKQTYLADGLSISAAGQVRDAPLHAGFLSALSAGTLSIGVTPAPGGKGLVMLRLEIKVQAPSQPVDSASSVMSGTPVLLLAEDIGPLKP